MTNQKIVRLNSRLYSDIWERGNSTPNITGDKLLAVYCILKNSRQGEIKYYSYIAKNNKKISGFNLLRAKTTLTLSVIQKYVPVLIEMGLCYIHNNGDFVLLGSNKINENYKKLTNYRKYKQKLVPIVLGENLDETATNVMSVRLNAIQRQQTIMIEKKQSRKDIICGKNYKLAEYYSKTYGEFKITDNTVLSNKGFAKLKDGAEDNKSKGTYWKNKLKKAGLVTTKRRFQKIAKMSYGEYLHFKKQNDFNPTITYCNGYIVRELVSSFKANDLLFKEEIKVINNKIKMKPLSYLSFDFIAWTINNE